MIMLAATIARRFYIDGESKSDIAESTGLSRFKIARMLELSVREGIIRFEIVTPNSFNHELSEEIRKAFNLRRVVVVDLLDGDGTQASMRQAVGRAAAEVLSELVTESDVLGVGWGRTLSAMAAELRSIPACMVVQMAGIAGSINENSLELARKIGQVGGGQAFPLFVPLIVQDAQTAASLRSQPGVAAAMKLADQITVAAIAVGSWNPPESQMMAALTPSEQAELQAKGVVAEVLSTLVRADGSIVTDLFERSIATSMEILREIPELILIAGGERKAAAVKAVLAAGFGTTLVTDNRMAEQMMSGLRS